MRAYLCELQIAGIETNAEEQLRILKYDRFVDGTYDTTSMEDFK